MGFEVQHQALAAMRYPQVPQIRADFLLLRGRYPQIAQIAADFLLLRGSLPRDGATARSSCHVVFGGLTTIH